MRSLLNEVIKNRITNNKQFCLDKASLVWQGLSVELQAGVFRGGETTRGAGVCAAAPFLLQQRQPFPVCQEQVG